MVIKYKRKMDEINPERIFTAIFSLHDKHKAICLLYKTKLYSYIFDGPVLQ